MPQRQVIGLDIDPDLTHHLAPGHWTWAGHRGERSESCIGFCKAFGFPLLAGFDAAAFAAACFVVVVFDTFVIRFSSNAPVSCHPVSRKPALASEE
jgi:hypothetical protein